MRLTMKLISLVIMLVITILGARALSGGSSSSIHPTNVVRNGLAGLCADQRATAAAAGNGGNDNKVPASPASQSAIAQIKATNPAGYGAIKSVLGNKKVSCPTSPTTNGAAGG